MLKTNILNRFAVGKYLLYCVIVSQTQYSHTIITHRGETLAIKPEIYFSHHVITLRWLEYSNFSRISQFHNIQSLFYRGNVQFPNTVLDWVPRDTDQTIYRSFALMPDCAGFPWVAENWFTLVSERSFGPQICLHGQCRHHIYCIAKRNYRMEEKTCRPHGHQNSNTIVFCFIHVPLFLSHLSSCQLLTHSHIS